MRKGWINGGGGSVVVLNIVSVWSFVGWLVGWLELRGVGTPVDCCNSCIYILVKLKGVFCNKEVVIDLVEDSTAA